MNFLDVTVRRKEALMARKCLAYEGPCSWTCWICLKPPLLLAAVLFQWVEAAA